MQFLVTVILQVLVLLLVVPPATTGGVAVRQGSFFRGILALLCIGLANIALWSVLTIATAGLAVVASWLTFGLVGVLVNALAFRVTGGLFSDVLYVRSFGSAFVAAAVMVVSNFLINTVLF